MATLYGSSGRPAEDLTSRARIVDAALAQFAERGSAGTTMRSVAEAAGVSVGLVQHHFKTKDGLREACDERVLTLVREEVAAGGPGGPITDPGVLMGFAGQAPRLYPYIARATLEDDSRAAVMFAELTARTEDFFTSHWPDRFPPGDARTRDAASVYTAMSLGMITLRHRLAGAMGLDPTAKVVDTRTAMGLIDVVEAFAGLFSSPFGAQLREAVQIVHDTNLDEGTQR